MLKLLILINTNKSNIIKIYNNIDKIWFFNKNDRKIIIIDKNSNNLKYISFFLWVINYEISQEINHI